MGYDDSAWKEGLEFYLEQAMALLFPEAHAQIDWSRGYEFLDKELQQILRDSEIGTRFVDKLAKIWLKSGLEYWVLLHVDVQGQPQDHFGRRMYIYNYRIFDRHGREVASLAILADDQPGWRPAEFGYNLLGCDVGIRFPTAKLLDFVGKEAELEASSNPFAVVVLAWLSVQQAGNDDKQRGLSKIRLVRSLYERGFGRSDVEKLFRLIDWLMVLPDEMENEVWRQVEAIEQEKHMELLTPREQRWKRDAEKAVEQAVEKAVANAKAEGIAEGRASHEAGIAAGLKIKFGLIATDMLMAEIRALSSAQMSAVTPAIMAAQSPVELRAALRQLAGKS